MPIFLSKTSPAKPNLINIELIISGPIDGPGTIANQAGLTNNDGDAILGGDAMVLRGGVRKPSIANLVLVELSIRTI